MPSHPDKSRVRALIQSHRLDEAEHLLRSMHEGDAQDAELWHLLATVTGMLGRFDESARWSRRVLERHPRLADAWMNLATALQHSDQYESALSAYRQLLHLQPDNVQVRLALAELYRKLENSDAAMENYRQAIRLNPQSAELHYNLGTFQQELGDYQLAEASYLKALQLKPALVQAGNNLGLVYQEQCRLEEAMGCFNTALSRNSDRDEVSREDGPLAEVHRHRALLRLLQGDFKQGWREYEWRHSDATAVKRSFSIPLWDGSSLEKKSLLVTTEQGIGDEIMFASCIPDLQRRAGRIILECSPRLSPLFQRSFPDAVVQSVEPANSVTAVEYGDEADFYIPIGSLPRYLRKSLDEFPRQVYLLADPEKVRMWQARYRDPGDGIKVGISWRGGGIPRIRKKRSIPLQQWLPVLMLDGIQFINLQYGDCVAELQKLADMNGLEVRDWADADSLQDMDNFAAQVAALDLVISVDNATMHITNTLGVPVWLLQTFSPEWRWLLGTEDSYWYSSVRQFRQVETGKWASVFSKVREKLIAKRDNITRSLL